MGLVKGYEAEIDVESIKEGLEEQIKSEQEGMEKGAYIYEVKIVEDDMQYSEGKKSVIKIGTTALRLNIRYVTEEAGAIKTKQSKERSIKELSYLNKDIQSVEKLDIVGYGDIKYNLTNGVTTYELVNSKKATKVGGQELQNILDKKYKQCIEKLVVYQMLRGYEGIKEGHNKEVYKLDDRDIYMNMVLKGYEEGEVYVYYDKLVENKNGVKNVLKLYEGKVKSSIRGLKESFGVDMIIVISDSEKGYVILEDKIGIKLLGSEGIIIGSKGQIKLDEGTKYIGIEIEGKN